MDHMVMILNKHKKYEGFYLNFFFEKWMSSRVIEGDITKEAKDFIMRRFWSEGTVACFNAKNYDFNEETKKLEIVDYLNFAPYAPQTFNMYDYPINLHLINRRGVSTQLIPNKLMWVNKDVVIGFCNRSHKPILFYMKKFIDRLVQIELITDNNLGLQNIPFLMKKNGSNDDKIDDIVSRILSGEIVINVDGDVIDDISLLETRIQFIADKLDDMKKRTMNEALTYLGCNNNPYEKKERQIVDEVNSNNQEIEQSDDAINDELDEFSNLIEKILGKKVYFISKFDIIKLENEKNTSDVENNQGGNENV